MSLAKVGLSYEIFFMGKLGGIANTTEGYSTVWGGLWEEKERFFISGIRKKGGH